MIKKWQLLESNVVFETPFLRVYQDKLRKASGGLVDNYFSIKRHDAVFVVALDKSGMILLVYQYKNGIKDLMWQIPAGFIDQGETAEKAASRELAEETGFSAKKFRLLAKLSSNSGISESMDYLFLAEGIEKTSEQKLDDNEEIEFKLFNFQELVEGVKKGRSLFVDTQSQLALLLAEQALKR